MDFSPDGRHVAVVWNHNLATADLDGGGFHPIPDSADAISPRWSPDSNRIVFLTQHGDHQDLMLYDILSGHERQLAHDMKPPFAWREDGQRLTAVHDRKGGSSELVWFDQEGAAIQHVPLPAIDVVDRNQYMVWLPNTDDVAFIAEHDAASDLYLAEAGEVHKVTTSGDVIAVGLSADRKSLLWVRKGKNLKYYPLSVYEYNLTSRSVKRLPFPDRWPWPDLGPGHALEAFEAYLSPDGTRLAILADISADPGQPTGSSKARHYAAVYTMRLDGSDVHLVRQLLLPHGDAGFLIPTWSRDGARIGILEQEKAITTLEVYNADGSGQHVLRKETLK